MAANAEGPGVACACRRPQEGAKQNTKEGTPGVKCTKMFPSSMTNVNLSAVIKDEKICVADTWLSSFCSSLQTTLSGYDFRVSAFLGHRFRPFNTKVALHGRPRRHRNVHCWLGRKNFLNFHEHVVVQALSITAE